MLNVYLFAKANFPEEIWLDLQKQINKIQYIFSGVKKKKVHFA